MSKHLPQVNGVSITNFGSSMIDSGTTCPDLYAGLLNYICQVLDQQEILAIQIHMSLLVQLDAAGHMTSHDCFSLVSLSKAF